MNGVKPVAGNATGDTAGPHGSLGSLYVLEAMIVAGLRKSSAKEASCAGSTELMKAPTPVSIVDCLLIFVGGFASVFTLGFQSRAVNAGNYTLAAGMAFLIAMSQAHLWTLIVSKDGDMLASAVYGLAGMAAITSAMFVHQRFFAPKPDSE